MRHVTREVMEQLSIRTIVQVNVTLRAKELCEQTDNGAALTYYTMTAQNRCSPPSRLESLKLSGSKTVWIKPAKERLKWINLDTNC